MLPVDQIKHLPFWFFTIFVEINYLKNFYIEIILSALDKLFFKSHTIFDNKFNIFLAFMDTGIVLLP